MNNKKTKEIKTYDKKDTTSFINTKSPLSLTDLDIVLPKETPTKVISLRLPRELLNKIQAYASQQDVPYTSVIKMILADQIENKLMQKSA